jgi:hypothetical protein
MGYLSGVFQHCANPRRGRRPERVLLDILSQLRGMLDITKAADAALFANLRNRLHDFDMRTLAIAHLASGICGNARNGRMFR